MYSDLYGFGQGILQVKLFACYGGVQFLFKFLQLRVELRFWNVGFDLWRKSGIVPLPIPVL